MKERNLTLSQKQLKTWMVIQRFIQKDITRQQAADLLGLSTHQISRLKKGVLTSGPESLIHKNTGRKPAHAKMPEKKALRRKKSENVPIAANESLIPGSSFKSMRLPSHGLAVLPNTPSTAPLTMPPERWSACF